MPSARIANYLKTRQFDRPCLIVDKNIVRENYAAYTRALPNMRVFYAVKANPAPRILSLLASLGSSFDCASFSEIELALATGVTPDRISFGNTIKKERDIARAFGVGVRLFAVDSVAEVEKMARVAPGARIFCRILCEGTGAALPLSRKFGCASTMALKVLSVACDLGLEAFGVSFHVGSQQTDLLTWDKMLAEAAWIFDEMAKTGVQLRMVNLGGGFPIRYLGEVPSIGDYSAAIYAALHKHFNAKMPQTIIEPGRGLVGNAGTIRAEVVLVSKRVDQDELRWVYLDIGKFGGLAETMDEAIRYDIHSSRHETEMSPCILAGPTCDSTDVLYEKVPYPLPVTLAAGDEILIEGAGAYTASYSAVSFNGFPPLETVIL
ncbi:MAG: type III PLP-dependent enzyme [Proteobacteria bacterium]|nr:type III PLP-dependent enzyme [Pseudomonadota bacterium]